MYLYICLFIYCTFYSWKINPKHLVIVAYGSDTHVSNKQTYGQHIVTFSNQFNYW